MNKKKRHKLEITLLDGVDVIVIKKENEDRFFRTTPNSILINRQGFITLLNFFVKNNIIDPRVLIGILEEYNSLDF